MVGIAFFTDLAGATTLPNRMDQLNAVGIDHPKNRGRSQEAFRPLPMGGEQAK
jgi:hypothetical protein